MMRLLFALPVWLLRLIERGLYLLIRTQVIVGRGAEFALLPNLPVVYVLQQRFLTDLLVLDRECRVRDFPDALTSPVRRLARLPRAVLPLYAGSGRAVGGEALAALIGRVQQEPDFDVQLLPVTILWGREPGTQDSILKALFAETWQAVGGLRHLITVLIHGRQTVVRFDAPGSLRELLRGDADVAHATRRVERIFRLHFHRERARAIGPDLSHRRTQMHALLTAREVREAIAAEAVHTGLPFARVERQARAYALEIAADYSYTVTRAIMLALRWVSQHVFEDLVVHHLDRLEQLPRNATLVYVPCHRSYLDGFLLNYFLYRHGMLAPHAVAGNNLNLPVIGRLLRGMGAFFLRRRIKGDVLYTTIFDQYMHQIISHGVPLQYYIEGTRSRSGRLLTPKTGMLGMTVLSYLRTRARPLVFVPVYFGYEKLMEGSAFLEEFGGKAKRGESLFGALLGARALAGRYGRVHACIGEPLRLSSFLDTQYATWREDKQVDSKSPWLRDAVKALGLELCRRINAGAVLHPVGLLALPLLATPRRTAEPRALERQLGHLRALAADGGLPSSVVGVDSTADAAMARAQTLGLATRIPHPLGDLLSADDNQAGMLAYARNNVLHCFAIPALLAGLVAHNLLLSRKQARTAIHGLYPMLQAELFLPWRDDEVDAVIDSSERTLVTRGLLLHDAGADALRAPPPDSEANADLTSLVEVLRAPLQRQFLILALLRQHGSGTITREELEDSAHLLAQRLADLFVLNNPDFAERALFVASIEKLLNLGLLTANEEGKLVFDERVSGAARQTQLLLAPDVRHSIERMTKHTEVGADETATGN